METNIESFDKCKDCLYEINCLYPEEVRAKCNKYVSKSISEVVKKRIVDILAGKDNN